MDWETPQVRAAALTNFDQVARFVGLDPDPLLRSAGLRPSDLASPDRRLPFAAVAGLLESAAARSGCAQFGLLMAESRSLASLGPLSLLLSHQPRVGGMVEAMVSHQRLFGNAVRIDRQIAGDSIIVRIDLAGAVETRQGNEFAIAYFCRCVAAALRRNWSPESVHFTHSAPSDPRVHWRIFSCLIDFGDDFNGIVCSREALLEENPGSDSELAAHAERLLGLIAPPPADLPSEMVRRSLRLLLPEQRPTIEEVARNMCLTPRTLQRLLEREGASFGALLNQVRRELAQKYLAGSHPIGRVAVMTGYRRASSFTRWFTAEFGMSPAEWRAGSGSGGD
jgi:AraC-like DNA-binding protein